MDSVSLLYNGLERSILGISHLYVLLLVFCSCCNGVSVAFYFSKPAILTYYNSRCIQHCVLYLCVELMRSSGGAFVEEGSQARRCLLLFCKVCDGQILLIQVNAPRLLVYYSVPALTFSLDDWIQI